jgi:acyl-CoA hydrolase
VLAQTFAVKVNDEGTQYSMSCNPEVTLDLLPLIEKRKAQGEKIMVVGQVNQQLPFIGNHALVDENRVDLLIDDDTCYSDLFSMPNMPVNMLEHFIGFNASLLVKDGGTLQIGIGALGDALTHALIIRDTFNDDYQEAFKALSFPQEQAALIEHEGGSERFEQGLYGCTEMFTNGILHLLQRKIIRREVIDKEGRNIVLHAGFFLGPLSMYESLKNLDEESLSKIDMLNISFVNALYGNEALKREQRRDARFVNSAFSATLLGAGIADQLEDGRVLSGVGGQYNFVAQAHELEGARSIIMLRATRESGGEISSNIVWSYGHNTIPRHLRDIFVTEYGIADLRGQSDSECIKRMLNICDSRFQLGLMDQAKQAGKLEKDYRIPDMHRNNRPENLQKVFDLMQVKGHFSDFPLGSDFDEVEKDLIKALSWLKSHVKPAGFLDIARHLVVSDNEEKKFQPHLKRMNLDEPATLKERLFRQLVLAALTSS